MSGLSRDIGLVHALLVMINDLGFVCRPHTLIEKEAFGQQWLVGGFASLSQQFADLNGVQSKHSSQIGQCE